MITVAGYHDSAYPLWLVPRLARRVDNPGGSSEHRLRRNHCIPAYRRSIGMNRTVMRMLVALALFVSAIGSAAAGGGPIAPAFTLTVLHNNDGESRLINAGTDLADYGG